MSRTLTGTFLESDGSVTKGKVLFSPSTRVKTLVAQITTAPVSVRLNSLGSFSISLDCTDDVSVAPSGWTWKVVEKFEGGSTYYVELPTGVGSIDLTDLVHLGTAPAVVSYSGPTGTDGADAVITYGTTAATTTEGNDSRVVGAAQKASNLSDLTNTTTARSSLGLGTMAVAATSSYAALAGATFTGNITLAKATPLLSLEATAGSDSYLYIQAPAGRSSFLSFRSTGSRWILRRNNASESGSNAGSNLDLLAYDDAGNVLNTLLTATRSSGATAWVTQKVISPTSAAGIPLIARGFVAQAANLIECQSSAAAVLASVSAAGLGTFAGITSTALVTTPASTAAAAGFNLPPGTTPTSPVTGDVWMTTGGGVFWRNGAATRTAVAIEGAQTLTGAKTFSALVTTAATASGGAGLNAPHGTAPTAPANGDIWTTTAGLFVRINGATIGPLT